MKSDDKKLMPANTAAFEEVVAIIERARENAFRAVNRELISMYWEIGRYISKKVTAGNWGKSVVQEFSKFIQSHFVGIKGFSPQNIWRMKQFYETYAGNEKLSTVSREISWSNNVLIMMAAKTDEEREFYLLLARKDDEVVEYALSRSMSPALIVEYAPQSLFASDFGRFIADGGKNSGSDQA